MAFNFYGVFTTGQFDKFYYFAKIQEQDLLKRISHLEKRKSQIGTVRTDYDPVTNYPVLYEPEIPYSYIDKLFLAYKALGGKPEEDFLIRNRDQPVYLKTGEDLTNDIYDLTGGDSREFSNGRLNRMGNIRADRPMGIQIDRMKNWQLEVIKYKRESLEYKIKRALDLSDEIQKEIDLLKSMIDTEDPIRSLDGMLASVTDLAYSEGSMYIVPNMTDIFGLRIGPITDVLSDVDIQNHQAFGERLPGGASSGKLTDV